MYTYIKLKYHLFISLSLPYPPYPMLPSASLPPLTDVVLYILQLSNKKKSAKYLPTYLKKSTNKKKKEERKKRKTKSEENRKVD